jgi:serine/threonine protein kinase
MSAPLLAASATTRSDPDVLKNKTYDLKEDVEASTWVVTLFKLKTNVERAKKFTGLIGLAGTSFMALKIAIVAGATLALPFPPLVIGVALLAATVALGIILYKLSLPKEVEEFQKVAQKFAKPDTPSEVLLPKVFNVNGARQGWFPKKVYAIKKIAKGGINTLTLMRTINPGLFKKPKLKMLRETRPDKKSGSTPVRRMIETTACIHQIALPKTFLNEDQEKTPLANGGDLFAFGEGLTPEEKVQIAVEILKKMVAFWKLGYVHRDLKPENFLVHEGKPYLADFDTAEIYNKETAGQFITDVGTAQFILRTGKKVNFLHADFYALGLTIVDLLDRKFLKKIELGRCDIRNYLGFDFSNVQKCFNKWIRSFKDMPNTPQSDKLKEIMNKLVTSPETVTCESLSSDVKGL